MTDQEFRATPTRSAGQPAAGDRGRAIARDSLRRTTAPLATIRHGAQAARHPARRAMMAVNTAGKGETKAGSASALTARAAPAAAGPRRAGSILIAAWSRCPSRPFFAGAVTTRGPRTPPSCGTRRGSCHPWRGRPPAPAALIAGQTWVHHERCAMPQRSCARTLWSRIHRPYDRCTRARQVARRRRDPPPAGLCHCRHDRTSGGRRMAPAGPAPGRRCPGGPRNVSRQSVQPFPCQPSLESGGLMTLVCRQRSLSAATMGGPCHRNARHRNGRITS